MIFEAFLLALCINSCYTSSLDIDLEQGPSTNYAEEHKKDVFNYLFISIIYSYYIYNMIKQ